MTEFDEFDQQEVTAPENGAVAVEEEAKESGTAAIEEKAKESGTAAMEEEQALENSAVVREEVMPEEAIAFPEPAAKERSYSISKRTILVLSLILAVILSLLMLLIGMVIGRGGRSSTSSTILTEDTEKKLEKIQQLLDQYFLFDMEDKDQQTGMIQGYMDALEDPYTVYYTPEEFVSVMETTSGTFTGIGVVVQQDFETGRVLVVRPYPDCPGANAGIESGDYILEVDGQACTDVDLNIVVSWIKGEEGTSVHMKLYRPSTQEEYEVDVTRAKIETETVSYQMLDGDIGYISLESFDDVTYGQFTKAFDALDAAGMKALVVDLRDNGGGLLSSVTEILDDLLPEGIITYTVDKNGARKDYNSSAGDKLHVPMAVLVNEYTASASEIFTGAVKDYDVATIVGTTTFGKGIVQVILPLDDGSAVKVTSSRYYTPNGVCIHELGIDPDIEVLLDPETEEDDQLNAALEVLREEIK